MAEQTYIPESVQTVRERLRIDREKSKGVVCPCCFQRVKLYKRNLNSAMVQSLIGMYKTAGTGWVHISQLIEKSELFRKNMNGGQFALTAQWGLIEECKDDNSRPKKKPHTGIWRLTNNGIAFLEGRISVPKYCHFYNGQCEHFSGEIDIETALGDKFDYAELMER